MKYIVPVFFLIIVASSLAIMSQNGIDDSLHVTMDKSGPYVGVDVPRNNGVYGEGIKIAVIDTGVDFDHPDLFGYGQDGKVIGGYNFIKEGSPPTDTNGHGTQVAGIIAADGVLKGVAPKAKILSYKVSEDGESVSSDFIIRAIEQAIKDDADIINISLGVNKTNPKIDEAVRKALENQIIVIAAAGNDGPGIGTIGSPGRNSGAITVGATYNNLTSSLVATLDVNDTQYTVVPMVGTTKLERPISAPIVFGGYGKEYDLKKIDAKDKILLVERGNDVEGELLYFSDKENNAANAGALGLIVFNNESGLFLGELTHEFIKEGYHPRIPTVSMDREDGLEVKNLIEGGASGTLHLFYNPDFVVHFSSRGPVSPFYIKPDLVAPGAFINSTQINAGYNFTSGTSFAAPHVSGAAALLLEKDPTLTNRDIRSILLTTTEPVRDAYGNRFTINDAGAGRLNLAKAFDADLVINPPSIVTSISLEEPEVRGQLELRPLDGTLDNIKASFEGPEFFHFSSKVENNLLKFEILADGKSTGDYDGRIFLEHDGIQYNIPVLIHFMQSSIDARQVENKLYFDVFHLGQWNFAKITVINSESGKSHTLSTTPGKDASFEIRESGTYWIEAKISSNGNTFDALDTITVSSASNFNPFVIDVPQRQIIILAGIAVAVGLVGLRIRTRA